MKKIDAPTTEERPKGLRAAMELFDVSLGVAMTALGLALLVVGAAIFWFIHSAPPSTITMSTGAPGSAYNKYAMKYQQILEQNGVRVNILTSEGSLQNLQRLVDPKSEVDLAFVQGGLTMDGTDKLMSLGSISYMPIMVFYRGKHAALVSEFAGKRIAVGPEGSGVHKFATSILEANGIKPGGTTQLMELEGLDAAKGIEDGKVDVAFVMSENTPTDMVKSLLRSKDIHLYSFKQASAYSRKIDFLNILDLPEGAIDFGQNIPDQDVALLGPMVELVSRKTLHPALVDLILEAATQVHNHPGVFQKRGEFPAPIEHAIRVSEDADRFHKSGKTWLYRMFPFWIASLLSRIVLVFLPTLVLLIPALKSVPAFFKWKVTMKLRKHYKDLLALEKEFLTAHDAKKQEFLRNEFDRIERAVNKMKISAAFADQFYGLRGHIDFVRQLATRVPDHNSQKPA